MRGIARGEQSSVSYPLLQLFVRSGGYLADIYSGSFVIECIYSHSVATATAVASTPITTAHRLGTGRYAIVTGTTSTWTIGTHRVVCRYKLTATGAEYVQVIPFEVLDQADYISGAQWVGYLMTRQAYQDSLVSSATTRQTLHRYIDRYSRNVEMWTKRHFDPRYLTYRKSGVSNPMLHLDEAVIAIEDVYALWQTATAEDYYKYDQYLYKVYNRHLDQFFDEDDRRNPRLELTSVDGSVVKYNDFTWTEGSQNIKITGVFGYTDPEFDPTGSRTGIGKTPEDIAYVVGVLCSRCVADPSLSDPMSSRPGAVKSYRTRDQAVTFGGSVTDAISDMSGDPLLDSMLAKYCAPLNVVGA